eukprot:CAMPEP_0197550814 /NCGR_PEP_ID=MMETSP1320-20131121/4279_1 /TAXON_ID=91990 /ORGANISM="Bolidomonas sp., Strain RCC2347" /LENGTH=337 /DNA_ID=CAMNT_0043111229 /DNA_START=26 /DNA_END=1036 /DNA_ORIENTATION=-
MRHSTSFISLLIGLNLFPADGFLLLSPPTSPSLPLTSPSRLPLHLHLSSPSPPPDPPPSSARDESPNGESIPAKNSRKLRLDARRALKNAQSSSSGPSHANNNNNNNNEKEKKKGKNRRLKKAVRAESRDAVVDGLFGSPLGREEEAEGTAPRSHRVALDGGYSDDGGRGEVEEPSAGENGEGSEGEGGRIADIKRGVKTATTATSYLSLLSSLYPEPFDPASLPPLELSYLLTCTLRLLSSLNLSLADESPPALGEGRSALAKTQLWNIGRSMLSARSSLPSPSLPSSSTVRTVKALCRHGLPSRAERLARSELGGGEKVRVRAAAISVVARSMYE